MTSKKLQFFAQIHSPVTGGVLRVQFSKGDRVKELVDVALERWGVSNREGWFPALILGRHEGYQLRLDDEIPTNPRAFFKKHEREFAWEWEARDRGLTEYRQYGDIIRYAELETSATSSDEIDVNWGSDDIHIALVTVITGG